MNNIRKILILVIMILLTFTSLPAEDAGNKYSFYLSPLAGFLYGQAEEIVYRFPGDSQYMSLLLWDLKPLVYAGLAGNFGPRNKFEHNGWIAAGSFKFGFPHKTGIMENRDWLGAGNNVTHFSQHNLFSQSVFLVDLSLGYSWRLNDYLALHTFAEFSFLHFSWIAKGGSGQYPFGQVSFNGPVIEYRQNWFIFSPGISLKGRINHLFSLEGRFNYSPLVFCAARDRHIERDTVFLDYLWWGHYFKAGGKLIFSVISNMDLTLYLNYLHITETRGNTNISGVIYNDVGGAAFSTLDMGIAAKIHIIGLPRGTRPLEIESAEPLQ